jgi:hypothetical protein
MMNAIYNKSELPANSEVIKGLDQAIDTHSSQDPPNKISTAQANNKGSYLEQLIAIEKRLREASKAEIQFAPEIISFGELPIIRKYTINTIQGREGSHKSRLAELFVSLLLKRREVHKDHFVGFAKNPMERPAVALVDTERNLKDELPFAIQSIKGKAGYNKKEDPDNFKYISLKPFPREDRLEILKTWITHIRETTKQHLVILLDVVTDCVGSFNSERESMALFDFIGNLCEDQECTFILIIHENPGGIEAKARGHLGTEAMNKASTALQIGFKKKSNGEPSELIQVKFRKLRRGKRPAPLNLTFSPQANGLIIAPPELVAEVNQEHQEKAPVTEVKDELFWALERAENGEISRNDAIQVITEEINKDKAPDAKDSASDKTVKRRLVDLEKEPPAWLEVFTGARNAKMYRLLTDVTTECAPVNE